ncbi:hypothetical protein SAMN04488589_0847 [Methanolobus vulcani]|uniref:Uncharacterized protein n=1 Tax=Methanolobus vulcani TaxID=38026 RepID=A0A7Z7AVC5_9EURY|nr:Ig-like domain-containing protein [Methanolobus vulcani]SDF54810.1 hypothetical protein SAMN04488589_0847 [Methanolobus vulcani]
MNRAKQYLKKYNRIAILVLLTTAILLLINPLASATSIQKFSIDGRTYGAGDSMRVTGEIQDGNETGEVKIIIWPTGYEFTDPANQLSNKTITASGGAFSTTMTVPADSGGYTVVAVDIETGVVSPYLYMTVVGENDPQTIEVRFTEGDIVSVSLSADHGITGSLNQSKTGGSALLGSTTYYFLVSDDEVAYVDDDPDMSLGTDSTGISVIGNLIEGSKVKLNGVDYKFININKQNGITLAKTITPSFTGGQSVNVTVLTLNASGVPIEGTITLENLRDNGTSISSKELVTNSMGLNTTTMTVSSVAGTYHLVAEDIGHISYVVNTMNMFGDMLSTENTPKHTFARGEVIVPVVYLTNISSGEPLSTATVTADITSKNNASYLNELELEYDSDIGAYTASYTIPAGEEIDTYYVEYEAVTNSQTQKAYTSYNIKAYEIFLKVISKNDGESDGFAPGEEGFLVIAGTNLSSGENIDFEAMTELDSEKFRLNITNNNGDEFITDWSLMNASTFFTYLSVPSDIQDEVEKTIGNTFAVINFTTPSQNGVYDTLVRVNISQWNSAGRSITVQDMFVHGEPVNKMGWFSPTVAPNSTARIMITAFDPSTGLEIPASDINDVGLIEAWSDSASEVVTEYMEDPVLTTINMPFVGDKKVLKFNVTDSYLGFHYVKFWVNATVDGTPKTVIGDGWFDEKLYKIKANPVFDDNSNMYKVFGADDTIELSVHIQDISGNNVSSASLEVKDVKYSMTGESISITDSATSVTTNSNGDATLTVSASNSLKSGFYSVRIKMTTQDGIIDYGNGWFEVSNFIFNPYSTSWEAGIDQPINFTLNAFDSSFNAKEVNITLKKVISMGDWDMMTPPTMYNDTEVEIGSINGTGYYEYPGVSRGGNFEFIFEATDGNTTEVGSAWVHTTAFVTWVDSNWINEFPTSGFINVTVKASEDQMWGSSSHNITNVTVENVMQEGMWMTSYKTKSQMAGITTTEAGIDPNEINVSINTSGWGQGAYMMTLKVTDEENNEVYTDFWFQLKLASVTITNPMRISISSAQYYTNVTSINATTDILTKKNQLQSIGNVSAGKISGRIIGGNDISPVTSSYEIMGDDSWNHSFVPYYSMVVVDSVRDTIYVEYENVTDNSNMIGNLSDDTATQVFNESVGSSFTDYTGRTWTITEIRSDGTIELEGQNTLKNGVMLNQSIMAMSKSGKFLMSNFHDDEWQNIDLDGDGEYYEDNYIVLMADSITSGTYDKVLVSNSYNFSAGYVDASAGEPIQFGGNPIYLLSNKYQSSSYQLEFSTYSKGWNGMNLGTFSNGSVIKIPFLVTTPSGQALANKEVKIDYLIDESKVVYNLENVNTTTTSGGLALLEINSSEVNIPTGSWMIHYNVTIGSEYAVANEEMFWELSRFDLRNFIVAGALGTPGQVGLIKLSDDNSGDGVPGNNMLLAYGDEVEFVKGVSAYNYGPEDKYNLNWPFDEWYYNSTTGSFNYSADGGATFVAGDIGTGSIVNSSRATINLDYNVTQIHNTGDTVVLNLSENTLFYNDMWNFTLTASSGGTATVAMSYVGWPWTVPGYSWNSQPETQSFTEGDTYWMGGFDFEVTNVTDANVTLTLRYPLMILTMDAAETLIDGNTANGETKAYSGAVTQVNFNNQEYYIFGYEDEAGTMYDLMTNSYINTKDSVLVVNASDFSDADKYRIGESINGFNDYYVASVSTWGGKFILFNGSVTQVYPVPEWVSDDPIFYTGTFSDEDLGMDIASAGSMFDSGSAPAGVGEITSDDRYHILLIDCLANGINMPTEATYDDDADLTTLRDWQNYMDLNSIYDLYTTEMGYGDSIPESIGDSIVTVNMSERTASEIGTGNMDSWPISFPTLKINDSTNTAVLKSFAPATELDVNDSITIFVTARDFDGTPVEGNAELKSLKMTFGGTYDEGMAADLPVTWNMSSAMINATLVDGEGILEIKSEDMGDINYDFGEYTAFVSVNKQSGGEEILKINFYRVNSDKMNMYDSGDMAGDPMGGGY